MYLPQPRSISRMGLTRGVGCVLALTVLLCCLGAGVGRAVEVRLPRVLILCSYGSGDRWGDGVVSAAREELRRELGTAQIFTEYMDSERVSNQRHQQMLREGLALKYAGVKLDAILACGGEALDFLMAYHRGLFPETPVVFCGLSPLDLEQEAPPWLRGAELRPGVVPTLEVARYLCPGLKQVVVVSENTLRGREFRRAVEEAHKRRPRLSFRYLDGSELSTRELLSRLQGLSPHSVVLYTLWRGGREGVFLAPEDALRLVSRASPVPVFGLLDVWLGRGMVGGKLLRAQVVGRWAARRVVELLRGGLQPQSAAVKYLEADRFLFDYRELERFGMSVSRLPPGSHLINQPERPWSRYRLVIGMGLTLIIVLGALVGVLAVVMARRRRVEEALRASEEKYRTILESMEEGYYEVDLAGNFTFFNDALARLLGYRPSEMMGINYRRYVYGPHQSAVYETFNRVLRTRQPTRAMEWTLVRADGSLVPVESSISLIYDSEGWPVGFRGICRDISERKRAEEALRASEERYRILVENLPYGLFIAELPSSRLVFVNRVLARMFGYPEDTEPKRYTVKDMVAPEEHQILAQRLARRLAGDPSIPPEWVYTGVRADGSRFRCKASVAAITYRGRTALQGFVRDVTEEEMLQRQLQQSQKMEAVGTLAGGVAHEFNNILMAIRGYVQLLARERDLSSPGREYIAKIEANTQRAAALTGKMLTFARQGEERREPLEIAPLLEEVVEMLRQTLPPNIDLELEVNPSLPLVTADRNQLEQVLLNLAVNARDAMPQGGLLSFRARQVELDHAFCHTHPWAQPGTWLELEVADTGEGMSPEVRERIFEPFFTTKEPGVGTGLGLAVAYSLITNHGGGILVHSHPGRGTRFRIYLPTSQQGSAPVAPPRPHTAPPRGKGQSVLVVDDEASVREICRQALSMHGYHVSEAAEGRMALELYRWAMEQGRPYDLVILDLAMPVMDGRQCLERLLRLDPGLRVIIATGHGYDDPDMDQLVHRAAGMLSKPFDLQSLLTEVARVLNP